MASINTFSVKEFAAARGVSVSQLAREAGIDRTVLSSALNAGTRRIPFDRLLPLARSLSVDPRSLIGPDDINAALRDAAA